MNLYNNIPEEMRRLKRWACCSLNPDDQNYKRPYNPGGFWVDVSDSKTWCSFADVVHQGQGIGFILSASDPYTVIDLDNKLEKPVSDETLAWYDNLARESQSYVERSTSGRGLHIVVKAVLPGFGKNRGGVEIYDRKRFIIFTGDVVYNNEITKQQELVDWLYQQMNTIDEPRTSGPLRDAPQTISDEDIMQMAWAAENGEKFQRLWWGQWQELGYPSQSEADLALMSMLAFYSDNNAQCLRLFRDSQLGKREKAVRDDKYLMDETLCLIRAKQPPIVEMPTLADLRRVFDHKVEPKVQIAIASDSRSIPFIFKANPHERLADPTIAPRLPSIIGGMKKPPGLIGEIADYIYSSAQRPNAEIALGAAMGMVAGIAGRAYNISQSGLNQYIVVIAKTGTGKEQIGKGIDTLFSYVRRFAPQADLFQGPAAFASGQSLARILPEKPVFVSVLGEFGLLLQGMSKAKPGEPAHTLKRALLDIYNKSGIHSWLKPTVYSDRERNTEIVQAPNVTFVGESTPEEFYKALDEGSIMDGFVPRLMVLEYDGDRPALNDNAGFPPPEALLLKLANLINTALGAAQAADGISTTNITQDILASDALRAFNDEIDHKFHGMDDGPSRQILNRAHFKAIKLAGLLAVGLNPYEPVVTRELADWAIEFVRREMSALLKRFEDGEIGEGQDVNGHITAIKLAIKRVLDASKDEARKLRNAYRFPPKLEGTTIIPHSFLVQYLRKRQPFKGDKRGPGRALDDTIIDMIKSGMLVKLTEMQSKGQYQLVGQAYQIGDVAHFSFEP